MMKKIVPLFVCIVHSWAGGWFYDQAAADEAHKAAVKNPLSRHTVSVHAGHTSSGFQGTGVVVAPGVVATADHVLRRHIDKMPCTFKKPFSEFQLGDEHPYFVHQPGALAQKGSFYAVDKIYALQACDLMFLVLEASQVAALTPASIVCKDVHSEWMQKFSISNMPRLAGSGQDVLPSVTYLGYGSWATGGTHPPEKTHLKETHNNGPHLYTDYKLRQGVFQVSQQFSHLYSRCGDIFYGWHNIRTSGYASPLLGDSGGPCFTEAGDLLGLISTIHVSEAFGEQPVVGAKITSLQGLVPDSREELTVWEAFCHLNS